MGTLLDLLKLTGLETDLAVQLFFPVAGILWLLVEFVVFRAAKRGGPLPAKLIFQVILLVASVSAFPMSWFAFMASFATSWPLLWASAAVFVLGGALGLFALLWLGSRSRSEFS